MKECDFRFGTLHSMLAFGGGALDRGFGTKAVECGHACKAQPRLKTDF